MLLKTTLIFILFLPFGLLVSQNTSIGLKLDTSITGFKYATNFDGMAVYTKNGISDISSNIPPSAFTVMESRTMTADQVKEEFQQLIKLSILSGYQLRDKFEKDTIINDKKVYFISYREMSDGEKYENRVFNGMIELQDSIVVFTSGDLDKGKYMVSFIKTFFSLIP
jgi:hypothetical protein